MIERYGFVPNTGGPGKFRGGLSIIRDYRILEDEVNLTLRSDKRAHPPHGLAGGMPGGGSMSILNPMHLNMHLGKFVNSLKNNSKIQTCALPNPNGVNICAPGDGFIQKRADPNYAPNYYNRKTF